MKSKFRKILCIALTLACLVSVCTVIPSSAATPYSNYFMSLVDPYSWSLPTPEAYQVSRVVDFPDKEHGKLLNPEDMFIGPDGRIYIADSGNNRIVILKSDLTFDFAITGYEEDGSKLNNPTCVFVDDDGTILVADYGNKRLIEFTKYGNFRFAYPTPSSDILSEDFNYQPQRVVKDQKGYIYVCSVGDSNGILMLSSDGEFRNYFGTNKVALTFWESIARMLWSRESRKGTVVTLPYTFNNIFIHDGFIYATCVMIKNKGDRLKAQESWEFVKWWMSEETQVAYAQEVEATFGVASRWQTANKRAINSMAYSDEELEVINEQWSYFTETPIVLGGYYTARYLTTALNQAVLQGNNIRIRQVFYVHG